MSFESDMDAAIAGVLRDMRVARNSAVKQVSEAIIDDTPVLTGDLRGSWHTSVDSDPIGELRQDPTGAAPKQELAKALEAASLDQQVVFANRLPYSEVIEYDGHSRKAPEGMVRKNLARWPTIGATLERGSNA